MISQHQPTERAWKLKKAKLVEQLKWIRRCATEAGIYDAMFLGYGSCLGAVRDRGIIEHDNDADVCFLADKFNKEQEDVFYDKLHEYGLFTARHRERRRGDTGRLLWCSVKREKGGMKTCIWFQQRYRGFYWHSKGRIWTQKIGLKMYPMVPSFCEAVGKGIPEHMLEELITVDWYGDKTWKIPARFGECLDFWYPAWPIPRVGGASKSEYILVIESWKNPENWHIRRR